MVGVVGNMLPTPGLEAGEGLLEDIGIQNMASIFLDALSEACLKTALAAVQTFVFSLLSTMELAAAASSKRKNELQRFLKTEGIVLLGMMESMESDISGKSRHSLCYRICATLAGSGNSSDFFSEVLSAQYFWYVASRCSTFAVVEKLALQYHDEKSAAGKHPFEERIESIIYRWNDVLHPCLSVQLMRKATADSFPEEYSPGTCKVGGDDASLYGPDTDVRLSSKEFKSWLATAKNKDGDDDNDDDDEEDDDEEEDEDDDEEGGAGEEEEGEEEAEGEEGGDDDDAGDDDDDEGDEGEEGDDGEDGKEEVEGDDDEEGGEDDDDEGDEGDEEDDGEGGEVDGDEEDGDDGEGDDEDEDEDKDDESSEPPKKKRK